MDFAYDFQTRRYLLQFMRVFSDIKIRVGPDANGLYSIQQVPIIYGDPSSLVSQVIKGGSENTMLPVPMFSAYIDSIKMAPDRRRDTQFVDKVSTVERAYNEQTQAYSNGPGVRYDIERYMPVPWDFYFKLDCWTSNTTSKLQIMEQINSFFNPSLQLQQNSNLLDWTSIFSLFMEDFTFTNRTIPQGADLQRDVMTWKFKVQGWLNVPAKIKRSSIIAEIVTNIYYTPEVDTIAASIDANPDTNILESLFTDKPTQIITTTGNYKISVQRASNNDEITLIDTSTNTSTNWNTLLQLYGRVVPNISKLRLKLDPNIEVDTSDIIGTIQISPTNPDVLIYTPDIDTMPVNTILPIANIIDPTEVSPGNGLSAAAIGQRYLLTSHSSHGEEPAIPPGVSTSPWGSTIVAYPNDIIEYNGVTWTVLFDSRSATGNNYVINNSNSSQYMFDGTNWTYAYYGIYAPGYWILENIMSSSN